MKYCNHCGAQANDRATFCSECGKPLPEKAIPQTVVSPEVKTKYCRNCGAQVNAKAVVCVNCGHSLSGTVSPQTTSRVSNPQTSYGNYRPHTINSGGKFSVGKFILWVILSLIVLFIFINLINSCDSGDSYGQVETECLACNGTGSFPCAYCGGSGTLWTSFGPYTCNSCTAGRVACVSCGGSGYFVRERR